MPIASGTRIGNYEVAALIGSGGMGEVYRAHDARLGRDVAIKVLPGAFSTDPDRLRRFEQEARAAAALNHPNILTVHEVGAYAPDPTSPAAPYVVSELLEGQTIRDVVGGGPLAIRRVVDYATQIASGLAAAHEKGVVHRDLKPENLFLTRDGRIKILDFGLAKLHEREPAESGATMAATRTLETGVGVVLGTAGYMSPEQVRAQPVDHRTDIFSFGAVLYELISGARAFRGETAADTISAILKNDPPELTSLNGTVPPALERIVQHCLEKAPELRFQAARDIVFNLEALSASPATSSLLAPAPVKPRRLGGVAAAAAAAVALVAVSAGATWWFATRSHDSASFRQITFRHGTLGPARFTADGQNIVYTAAWEALPPEVFIVPAAETGGRSLELKDAALLAVGLKELAVALKPARITPFLTPGTLARGSMTGGAPKPEIENVQAADYAPDGSSLAIARWDQASRTCRLEFPIGKEIYRASLITDLRFSRDGTHLAFIEHPSIADDRGQAVILRTDGSKVATGPMRESHRGLAWSLSGDEVWTTSPLADGVVVALDLNGRTRELLNVPGRLHLRDVRSDGHLLMEQGTVSRGMIVVTNDGATQRDLTWLNYSYVRDISRDGQMLLFEEEGQAGYRTFVRKTDGSPAVEIGAGYAVVLSHDNSQALSLRLKATGPELWLEPVGPGQARRINPPELAPAPLGPSALNAQFFADGKRIIYVARHGDRPPRIYTHALDGSAPRPVSDEGYTGGLLSADEQWIFAQSPAGPVVLPIEGGASTPVRGLQRGEAVRRWTTDGRLFVAAVTPTEMRVDRLNPWTGERTPWRRTSASAVTGMRVSAPFITPDGSVYAYGYNLSASDLYVVSGVR